MRCDSVFRVGYFVQMVSLLQIKFTLTVARALHRSMVEHDLWLKPVG
jgi:hypothetical protein